MHFDLIIASLMKSNSPKKYDCVAEVRKARAEISKDLKGKSTKEILAYFNKATKTSKTK